MSGETGAGKSIIINAVNLLLGSRATSRMIRTGADNAELEAFFDVGSGSSVALAMAGHDIDPADGLLIRRIISRNDRHRIYLNGRLATSQMLNVITGSLASISGQHAHQGLLREEQHLLLLDQFAGLMPLRESVTDRHRAIQPLIRKLNDLRSLQNRQTEQIAYLEFQKNEIESAAVEPGEDDALEGEKIRLKNARTLYQTVHESIESLYGAPGAAAEQLAGSHKALDAAGRLDPQLAQIAGRTGEAVIQLEDIVAELRTYLQALEADDGRLESVEERLDLLNRLKRKYGGSLDAVIERKHQIDRELADIEQLTDTIRDTEHELSGRHRELAALAEELSGKRKEAAAVFSRKVIEELAGLNMADTEFQVALKPVPVDAAADPFLSADEGRLITESGLDRAQFMIAPNVGEALKPLASIASGGELSRVVLALKAILAQNESVETVVFDEVDTGIGGGTAEMVGRKLLDLAGHHQIICITHLPQIAKFGRHHFRIEKHVTNGRTRTTISPLSDDERVRELARMLGGENLTTATLNHAREMLGPPSA